MSKFLGRVTLVVASIGFLVMLAPLPMLAQPALAAPPWPEPQDPRQTLDQYFRMTVDAISEASDTRQFKDAESWLDKRDQFKDELADMLGLNPAPSRTDLKATIVGSVQRDGIIVERVHFQSVPGLYVTANLYRPVESSKPLPAILYVCGHSVQRETVNGTDISYGNKTGYQRHGAWFARNGYVCLTIDTIQWGEFLGTHWGTYREGQWDWLSKGYTPAGVEAWNGIRAIDYLQTRPEVDASRIGLTGRSGGGAYSWFIAALDARVKAVVPVAGITDLENHVIDGCVSGHCDCMYMVNYYRWDYPRLAALIAPRPLLLANSDSDGIFPLDGVLRTANQVRHVYKLLGASDAVGLLITPGPHKDTPELQVGAFRWFDRHLKGIDVPVDEAAIERFKRQELKVFGALPDDQVVRTADDVFGERLRNSQHGQTENPSDEALAMLKQRSFAGWPQEAELLEPKSIWKSETTNDSVWELWEYTSQKPWRLRALVAHALNRTASATAASDAVSKAGENEVERGSIRVHLTDDAGWERAKQEALAGEADTDPEVTTVYLAVRGIGPHAWQGTGVELTHIKRRFYLLGETLEGMQIWDALRGIDFAAQNVSSDRASAITLTYDPAMEGIAAIASQFTKTPSVKTDATLPADHQSSVPLLGSGQIEGMEALFGR